MIETVLKAENTTEKPIRPFKTFASVETIENERFAVFSIAVMEDRLREMIKNKDYALDTIKVLSYYFETNEAERLLRELEKRLEK